jgi:hypothetical protein
MMLTWVARGAGVGSPSLSPPSLFVFRRRGTHPRMLHSAGPKVFAAWGELTNIPPPPLESCKHFGSHVSVQGGGVGGPRIAFRFLNLKWGNSASTDLKGGVYISGSRWRRAPPRDSTQIIPASTPRTKSEIQVTSFEISFNTC